MPSTWLPGMPSNVTMAMRNCCSASVAGLSSEITARFDAGSGCAEASAAALAAAVPSGRSLESIAPYASSISSASPALLASQARSSIPQPVGLPTIQSSAISSIWSRSDASCNSWATEPACSPDNSASGSSASHGPNTNARCHARG